MAALRPVAAPRAGPEHPGRERGGGRRVRARPERAGRPVPAHLVPTADVRVERQLQDQHRQRLLRRLPVRPVDVAQRGRQRVPEPGLPRRAGRPRPDALPHARLAAVDVREHPRPAQRRRRRLRPHGRHPHRRLGRRLGRLGDDAATPGSRRSPAAAGTTSATGTTTSSSSRIRCTTAASSRPARGSTAR